MRRFLFLTIFTMLELQIYAQTTYTFHTAGNWTDEANWSPSYPGTSVSNSNIVISSDCNIDYPSIIIYNCESVTITDNTTISGNEMIIYDSNLINNGNCNNVYIEFSRTWGNSNLISFVNDGILDIELFALGNTSFINNELINCSDIITWYSEIINNGTLTCNLFACDHDNVFNNSVFLGNIDLNSYHTDLSGNSYYEPVNFTSSPNSSYSPGNSPGKMTFNIPSCFPISIYNCEINGTTPETQYDQIAVTNCVNLTNATLNVTWGFTPSAGQEFTILTYGSKIGEFNSVNIAPISGLSFTVQYNYTNTKIIASTTLPLKLLEFDVLKSTENKCILTWQTTSENSLSHFTIQRSSDADNWEDIGELEANNKVSGTNSYSFIDDQPLKGINYYRLRINDQNGNFEYSPVRSVYFGDDDAFEAYGSDRTITIINNNHSKIHYFVYNSIGRIVADTYDREIPVPQSGIYLVSDGVSARKVYIR